MKCIKTLGLAAMAVAALSSFAATASATTVTSPTGTAYTGVITATSETGTKLHGSFITIECGGSHFEGKIEKHGAGITAGGKIITFSYEECNYAITVAKAGSFEIHHTGIGQYGTGTLTFTGSEMSIATSVGTCVFTTTNTDMGTITPTNDTNGHATIDHGSAKLPRTGGNFLCGSSATLTGSMTITTPSALWIDS